MKTIWYNHNYSGNKRVQIATEIDIDYIKIRNDSISKQLSRYENQEFIRGALAFKPISLALLDRMLQHG